MTDLSPAAQAVWDAAWVNCPVQCGDIKGTRRAQIAAALIAAADQVVPENAEAVGDKHDDARADQCEPKGPTAWMYLGEPDYDGRDWHDHWEVTLDEKLARYMSDNKDPVPLWRTSEVRNKLLAIAAELEGKSNEN